MGRWISLPFWCFVLASIGIAAPVGAEEITFSAQVDRTRITEDDSVALKFSVKSEGSHEIQPPQYSAPDFDVINQYSSNYVESYYDNGVFGMRNTQQMTQVLRPKKTGELKITNLSVRVDGKLYTAPPIAIDVRPGGAGTPPPRGYGSGSGLRGAGRRMAGPGFFIRPELDKQKAFKGEQIIVSYYLYRRVKMFNIQVNKYPDMNGFLREDLDMPVLGQRLETDQTVLDGVLYERSLLARYAIYPLKEGKLTLDPFELKANYYTASSLGDDEDPFSHFFQQLTPRTTQVRSDPVSIEVSSLPSEGRPAGFSGAIGDFSLALGADRTEVRAGEAVTLTLKVEGRGNVSAVEAPKVDWPPGVEQYDTKGTARSGRGGVGEKVFEYVLIPRQPGKLTLPKIDFTFFDPSKKAYVTRSTEPFDIQVLEGLPGAAPGGGSLKGQPSSVNPTQVAPRSLRGLKDPQQFAKEESVGVLGKPLWRWMYVFSVSGFLLLLGWAFWDGYRRWRGARHGLRSDARASRWEVLSRSQSALQAAEQPAIVIEAYEQLSGLLFDLLEERFRVDARSLPRSELGRHLVQEKGVTQDLWSRFDALLEFAETVRFASEVGAVSLPTAKEKFPACLAEARDLEGRLSSASVSSD